MPHEVIMPALGMAQETGQVVAWLKAPGDKVSAGEALMEVETDKATMEVEAQADGWLTDVRAKAGDDVPVGQVVAVIADSPDAAAASVPQADAPPAPDADEGNDPGEGALPEGAQVIMPALGMAQDTGKLLAWLKAPGDAVAPDDPLFEVETDKAAMEVPAGHDGYLAAVLAEEGQDVTVGDVIAVISVAKPEAPVARGAAAAPKPQPEKVSEPALAKTTPVAAPTPAKQATPARADGRILASPKARRLAAERGLDLARLAAAGHPQPYHVADLEVLATLPGAGTATGARDTITARIPAGGFAAFCDFVTAETGSAADAAALLAGFAAAALRSVTGTADALTLQAGGLSGSVTYTDPDLAPLSFITPDGTGHAPALILRDLRGGRITALHLGADTLPVMTVAQQGDTIEITFDAPAGQFSPGQAVALVSGFAARVENALHHLL